MEVSKFKAFMKPELKEEEILEYPGVDTFKDENGKPIPFKIKCLGRERINEIRKMYRKRKIAKEKNGRPVINGNIVVYEEEYDNEKSTNHIIVDAIVYPDLKNKELMDYYGVVDVTDMPSKLFHKTADFEYINKCIAEACGLSSEESEEEEETNCLKN